MIWDAKIGSLFLKKPQNCCSKLAVHCVFFTQKWSLKFGHPSENYYLLRCEDRRTYQCHPNYRTIGRAVQLSENTVRKYVTSLEEKGLIRTEPSTIITKDGRVRNGSLIYNIRPIRRRWSRTTSGNSGRRRRV